MRFLSPARSLEKDPPSARPRRLLPKHQSASKSGVWRQCWLSWSWRRRVFQQAWRALVARPGAQLARGAAAAAVPVYASPCCQSVLGRLSSRPCVPHSKRHNRIPQRGVTCRRTDGWRNGLAMQQQPARACDQEGVEVTCSQSWLSLPTRCHYIQSSGSSLRLRPPLTQTLGQRQIQ